MQEQMFRFVQDEAKLEVESCLLTYYTMLSHWIILYHNISCHIISYRIISHHITSNHFMSFCLASSHVTIHPWRPFSPRIPCWSIREQPWKPAETGWPWPQLLSPEFKYRTVTQGRVGITASPVAQVTVILHLMLWVPVAAAVAVAVVVRLAGRRKRD